MDASDSEKQAEFERQQFDIYEARRLAEESHANTVVAAAFAVAGLVLANFARHHHRPWWLWAGFGVAMVGLLYVIIVGINARVVSWDTRLGGVRLERKPKPRSGLNATPPDVERLPGTRWLLALMRRLTGRNRPAEGKTTPSDCVKETLYAVRAEAPYGSDLDWLVYRHWRARVASALELGKAKGRRVRWSVVGFVGPLVYFIVELFTP